MIVLSILTSNLGVANALGGRPVQLHHCYKTSTRLSSYFYFSSTFLGKIFLIYVNTPFEDPFDCFKWSTYLCYDHQGGQLSGGNMSVLRLERGCDDQCMAHCTTVMFCNVMYYWAVMWCDGLLGQNKLIRNPSRLLDLLIWWRHRWWGW